MKWKKRLSEIFLLILTFLIPAALSAHKDGVEGVKHRQHGANKRRSLVPGHQTAILQNGHVIHLDHLRLLDPYNLIASVKENGNKLNPILAELLPQNSMDGQKRTEKHANKQNKDYLSKTGINGDSLNHKINNNSKNSDSIDFKDSETKVSGLEIEDPYFDDNDFDLYDDYDNVDLPKKSFNHKSKVGRRRKKGNSRNANVHNQNALLHEAVRKLLGFSRSHSWSQKNSRLLPDPFGQEKIPRYVKDLYERFQSGEMNAGLAQGNTIRSIHANIGDVQGESMFLFNLSSLRSSEQLLNAEIHLYKRRPRPKGQRNLDIEVKLYRVAPHYLSEVGRITMRDDVSHGWLWYDVTNAVQNCLTPRRHHSDLFALSFKVIKPNGKIKSVSLRKFGRHHSKPFLVLYSNETEAVSFEHLDILTDRLWPKEKDKNHVIEADISSDRKPVSENSNSTEDNQTNKKKMKSNGESTSTFGRGDLIRRSETRNKRSIYDNEIPENPVDDYDHYSKYHFINTIPQTHPGILKTRKESRIDLKANPSLLPLPDPYSNIKNNIQRKRRKKHHRNRKYHHRKNRLTFPKEWDTYVAEKIKLNNNNYNDKNVGKNTNDNNNAVHNGHASESVCGRNRLTVDFADIGWGDWIISPKSFEAHYCAGSCPFPLNKRLHPSNHATIQSIVHAIGIHSNVPAPCCVPDKMSSVTLLYFDEDRNVVLKNYPGMTVESCACR